MATPLIYLLTLIIPSIKPCLQENITPCLNNLPQIETRLKLADKFINHPLLSDSLSLISALKPFIPYKDYLLNSKSLILLQNNTEIRPTGGFIGSYAKLKIKNLKFKIDFNDIYVPDGQVSLTGHVPPPPAIQTAFNQGEYRLANANFEADFPTSAASLRWFFEKGGEINPDLLIAANLSTIKKVLKITGSFSVPQYNIEITPDNAYALLQNQAELNFFPGSTQKKDALSAVGKALFKQISALPLQTKLKLAKLLIDELNNGEILINSANPDFQNLLLKKSFAGLLSTRPGLVESDFFAAIETNLGANKANTFITRQTNHVITSNTHQIQISFKNSSPFPHPRPPRFYGGNYINFIRLYIPQNASNIQVQATPIPDTKELKRFKAMETPAIKPKYNLTEISFFHITLAGKSSQINLTYQLPNINEKNYSLTIYKQPGIENSPQHLNIFGQTQQLNLTKTITTPQQP